MAVGINTIWESRTTATASNVNGAGFDPEVSGANLLADLTTDSNTGNTASPVVSSASYNFVAGDVSAYVFIQSGTNWVPGWYQIASVASNKATLTASVGSVVKYTSGATRSFALNTAAGIATVGTPTAGVFTIDYSQQDSNKISLTDLACTTPSTTVTSATGSFTPVMVGNILHINSITGTGTLVGWYEIMSYTNATTVVLDRTPAPTNNATSGNFRVGGAASLSSSAGATDDAFFENGLGTNGSGAHIFFIKSGTFGSMAAVSIAAAGGAQAPIRMMGYNTIRTEAFSMTDLGSNRPTLAMGANGFASTGGSFDIYNIIFTGSAAALLTTGNNSKALFVKGINTSTTASRVAMAGGSDFFFYECEGICYRGIAISIGSSTGQIYASYTHDSDIGIKSTSSSNPQAIINCISAGNITSAISMGASNTAATIIQGCTLYGAETQTGTGISITSGTTDLRIINCTISGFVTGVSDPDTQTVIFDDYNNYYNNGTDASGVQKGPHDVALNPTFTSVTQISGTGATSLTNILTDASGTFGGITDNVDFLVITSGSGTGILTSTQLLITSHTSTTLTVSSNITTSGAGTAIAYRVSEGHNFAIGTNLKALGYPGLFPGGLTTGYLDIGGVQRQESGGSAGMLFIPDMQGT